MSTGSVASLGGSPRGLKVISSQMDLEDVSGRVLFPSPNQGPWIPFLRVAETRMSRQGNGAEGHDHREEEVLNYVLEGLVEHEDDTGVKSLLEPGAVSLLTARVEGHHNLVARTPPAARWLSLSVRCPPTAGGPPHLVQLARGPIPTRVTGGTTERHLVGRGGAVASGSGLDCVELEFGAAAQCVCPVGRQRRAVAYVFEGSTRIGDHLVDAGAGALLESVAEVSFQAGPATRVLLASAPVR
jgi:redox-sensitive bicupin YhaK (pirin superfamily)